MGVNKRWWVIWKALTQPVSSYDVLSDWGCLELLERVDCTFLVLKDWFWCEFEAQHLPARRFVEHMLERVMLAVYYGGVFALWSRSCVLGLQCLLSLLLIPLPCLSILSFCSTHCTKQWSQNRNILYFPLITWWWYSNVSFGSSVMIQFFF